MSVHLHVEVYLNPGQKIKTPSRLQSERCTVVVELPSGSADTDQSLKRCLPCVYPSPSFSSILFSTPRCSNQTDVSATSNFSPFQARQLKMQVVMRQSLATAGTRCSLSAVT